jgi:hypothetical protein
MGREGLTQQKMVKVKDVVTDKECYPRDGWNHFTAYSYSQAMRAGAKFPPIVVALNRGRYILVDGKHRLEAKKILKQNSIEAEVVIGWSKRQIYEEAVRRNVTHGKALSIHERRQVGLRLRNWQYPPNKISELIQVPMDKLTTFIEQRLTNAITGDVIAQTNATRKKSADYDGMIAGQVILKSGIRNAESFSMTKEEIDEVQQGLYAGNQKSLIQQLIKIIKHSLLDKDKKTQKLIIELKELLNEKY